MELWQWIVLALIVIAVVVAAIAWRIRRRTGSVIAALPDLPARHEDSR